MSFYLNGPVKTNVAYFFFLITLVKCLFFENYELNSQSVLCS